MKHDLKNMSRKELERLRRDIDKALDRVNDQEKKAALEAAMKAARAHGFSLAELTGARPNKPAAVKKPAKKPAKKAADGRAKVAPKYRNPDDAAQTWSGRGRRPKWIDAYLAGGGALDAILI